MTPPNLTPEQVQAQLDAWLPVIKYSVLALIGLAGFIVSQVQAMKGRLDKHDDRLHDLALGSNGTNGNNGVQASAPAVAPTVKAVILPAMAGLAMGGCVNQPPAQKIATGQQIFSAPLDGWSATNGGKTITPQVVQEIGNNIFAIAAATQANVGQTPTAANVAQYSADPNVGTNVQLVLPNTPITQAQADAAFDAAKIATAAVVRTP